MRFADVQWPARLSLLRHFAAQYKSLVIIINCYLYHHAYIICYLYHQVYIICNLYHHVYSSTEPQTWTEGIKEFCSCLRLYFQYAIQFLILFWLAKMSDLGDVLTPAYRRMAAVFTSGCVLPVRRLVAYVTSSLRGAGLLRRARRVEPS